MASIPPYEEEVTMDPLEASRLVTDEYCQDSRGDLQEAEVRDRLEPGVRHSDRCGLPSDPCPRARRPHSLHRAGVDPEGQAHFPLHVPVEERVHLLRERPAAGAVPARDRDHEGLRRRLESRRRRGANLPNPITPPPQPTGRTENPSACLFY